MFEFWIIFIFISSEFMTEYIFEDYETSWLSENELILFKLVELLFQLIWLPIIFIRLIEPFSTAFICENVYCNSTR